MSVDGTDDCLITYGVTPDQAAPARPPSPEMMRSAALELHRARLAQQDAAGRLSVAQEEWRNRMAEANAELTAAAVEAGKRLVDADSNLRELALQHYAATGERKAGAGVEVVMRSGWRWDDEAATLAWARETGIGLDLDRNAIEKVAKVSPVPGLTETSTLSTRVASDLTKVLAGAVPE